MIEWQIPSEEFCLPYITARVLGWARSFAGQTVIGIVLGLGAGIGVPILTGGVR